MSSGETITDNPGCGELPAPSSRRERRGGVHRRSRRRKTLSPSKLTSFMDGVDIDDPANYPDIPMTGRSDDGAADHCSAAVALVASPLTPPKKSPVQSNRKALPLTAQSPRINGQPIYASSDQIAALFDQSPPDSKASLSPPLGVLDAVYNQRNLALSGEGKSPKKGLSGAGDDDSGEVTFDVENLRPVERKLAGDGAFVSSPAKSPLSSADGAAAFKQTLTTPTSSVSGETGGGEAVRAPAPAPAVKRKSSRSSRRRSIVMPSEAKPFIDSAVGEEGTATTKAATTTAPPLRGGKANRSSKHRSICTTASKTAEEEFPLSAVNATSCLLRSLAVERGWKTGEGDDTRTLIRKYHAAAQGSQRARRIAARLFCLTGFCLMPQTPDDARVLCAAAGDSFEWGCGETEKPRLVSQPRRCESREQMRELVLRMKPLFAILDEESKTEKLAAETATGVIACKAFPDGYCYKDRNTGEPVDPAVYKTKYMKYIRAVSAANRRKFASKRTDAPTAVLSGGVGGATAAQEVPAKTSADEIRASSVSPAAGVISTPEREQQVEPRDESSVTEEPSGEPSPAVVKMGGMHRAKHILTDGSRVGKMAVADVVPVTAHAPSETSTVAWVGVRGLEPMEAEAEPDKEGVVPATMPERNEEGGGAGLVTVKLAAQVPIATAEGTVDGKVTAPASDTGNGAATDAATSSIAAVCVGSPSVDVGAEASSAPTTPAQPELDQTSASDASVTPLLGFGCDGFKSCRDTSEASSGDIKNAWPSRRGSSDFVAGEARLTASPKRSEPTPSAVGGEPCLQPACSIADEAVASLPPSREHLPFSGTSATHLDGDEGSVELSNPLAALPVSCPIDVDDVGAVHVVAAAGMHEKGVEGSILVDMERDSTLPGVHPVAGGNVISEVALFTQDVSQDTRELQEELAALEERLFAKIDETFTEHLELVKRVRSRYPHIASSPATSSPSRGTFQTTTTARSSPLGTTTSISKEGTSRSASTRRQDARRAAAVAAVMMTAGSSPIAGACALKAAPCPTGADGGGQSSPLLPSSAVENADQMTVTPLSPLLPLHDLRLYEEDGEFFRSSRHEEAGSSTVSSNMTRRRNLRQSFSFGQGKHAGVKQQHKVGLNVGVASASGGTRDCEEEGKGGGGVCGLCYRKDGDTLLRPCEHVTCGVCAEKLKSQSEQSGKAFSCPWDRQLVTDTCPLQSCTRKYSPL